MSFTVEIGPWGDPDLTIGESRLSGLDVTRVHSALSDAQFTVPYDPGLRDYALERLRIYASGQLVFRGYLEDFGWSEADAQTTLYGRGIAKDLKGEGIEWEVQNLAAHRAIREFLQDETDFDEVEVWGGDGGGLLMYDGYTIVSAGTESEFEPLLDIDADEPLSIDDYAVRLLQSSWLNDTTEMSSNLAQVVDDEAANGGQVLSMSEAGAFVETTISPEYDISSDHVGVAVRLRLPDQNVDGEYTGPRMELNVGNKVLQTFGICFSEDDDAYHWHFPVDGPEADLDLNGGEDYPVVLEVTDECETDPTDDQNDEIQRAFVDAVVVYDTRHDYDFPETVGPGGYLSGPQEYPDEWTARFPNYTTTFNVISVELATDWSDTSGAQSLEISVDEGISWETAENTDEFVADFSDNVGTTIDTRVTFSRHGDRSDAAPTNGYLGQELYHYDLKYDGDDLAKFEDKRYQGSALDILGEMCEDAGFRWVADHDATDEAGEPIKRIEVFRAGVVEASRDWVVINRNPDLEYSGYANHVTIWGGEDEDGSRPMAVAEHEGEIDGWGLEGYSDVRPNIDTVEDAKSEARGELRERVESRELEGSLDVRPTNILPGYDYPVDWFNTGEVTYTHLEEVNWSTSYQDDSGQLQFSEELDTSGQLIRQARRVRRCETSI